MPSFSRPGEAAFETFVADRCEIAFLSYVGTMYESSRLEMSWFEPTIGIPIGDPTIQCILRDPGTPRLTTSLKRSKL